ncbi:MAG: ThiF family adenylyltransferase [Terriglobia bacterium]
MILNPHARQIDRYSRQTLFPPIGREGQAKLRTERALILGCGALGTAQAMLLARAGVGDLRVVDRDYVETSNLQRQAIFDESDAAQRLPKAVAAERKLRLINSDIKVTGIVADAYSGNIEELIAGASLVLDGCDNFETRFLLNDAAVKHNIPWIYGAVVGSYGVTLTVLPGRTACLACALPELPRGLGETCDTAGVIGPAVNWVASMQTAEALKILTGSESCLHGKLMDYDIWTNRFQQVGVARDPACRACGKREFAHLRRRAPAHTSLCGRDAVQIRLGQPRQLDLAALERRLAGFAEVHANAYLLQCRVEQYQLTVFSDGRALIKGTDDPAVARSLYARYISA